jgi:hypothetical protein
LDWEWVAENRSFVVEYNKELDMYRVVYLNKDGSYKDGILFDREAGIDD